MYRIEYEGAAYNCREGETVLDALIRQSVSPPFSCRNGVCLVCLQRCVKGAVPENAQGGLRPTLRQQGYFLPCKCVPSADMEIAPTREADLYSRAVVYEKKLVAPDVCRILLEPATSLYYHAGQFINVRRHDGLTRSYSLASLPMEDYFLEIHVKRLPSGEMSNWIFDELKVGDELEFQGPHGSCYYVPGTQDQDILLIGTGTGLAPLAGIVRDALHSGHQGRLILAHGSRRPEGLYLHERLRELAKKHKRFLYLPCVSGEDIPSGFLAGRAYQVAFAAVPDRLPGWRLFVAGLPAMVDAARTMALRAGVHTSFLHVDPYEVRSSYALLAVGNHAPVQVSESSDTASEASRSKEPPEHLRHGPDPEMWEALQEGELLREILTDFYTRVFEDPVLSPYFRGITKDRLIGQVFSFMRDTFKGEKLYFGARPKSAHHWMVISDETFDYRERIMVECLERYGLPQPLINRWRRFEEGFRVDIVKSAPRSLVVQGVEMPLEGFGEEEISVGTICDGCGREIHSGERVRYHLRLGHTYCPGCAHSSESGSLRTANPSAEQETI
jgi:NAD(P)H-flavin reductase/truncated hemoglobin YjbI